MKSQFQIKIGWLYPELMSTYGDRGNITVLQKRCEWRGMNAEILRIDDKTSAHEIETIDLLFGGGAQDREQEIVMKHLKKQQRVITNIIEHNVPAIFVCGSPQLMGKYYEPAEGKRIEGLGIFDIETKHPGLDKPRLIGNLVAEVNWNALNPLSVDTKSNQYLVGFENHGGRTHLGSSAIPFATVIKGFGNNGEDKTEGVIYKNAIGCYLHGSLLPKNPQIADWLIAKALERKYAKQITLGPLDDSLENKAKSAIAKRLGIEL